MYSIEWLKNKFENEDKLKFLFFWGHTADKNGVVTSSCLSQWWPCEFMYDGLTFKSTEHWMMYKKSMLFNDLATAEKILKSESPGEAKKLGREVLNFENDVWNQHRMDIVVEGNVFKFSQNKDLETFLLNTKDRILVEASPVDEIWGIGLSKDSEKIHNPNNWRGLNLLGFALMEVRDRLMDVQNTR